MREHVEDVSGDGTQADTVAHKTGMGEAGSSPAKAEEQKARYLARNDYRLDGTLDGYRAMKKGSQERLWYLDEAHKIKFEQEWSGIQ